MQEKIYFQTRFSGRVIEKNNAIIHKRRPLTANNFDQEQYFSMRPKTADRYHSTTIKSILMKTPPQPLNIMSSRKMCRRPPTPHWHLKQYDYTHKDISNVVMLLCVPYHIIKICISFTSCLQLLHLHLSTQSNTLSSPASFYTE